MVSWCWKQEQGGRPNAVSLHGRSRRTFVLRLVFLLVMLIAAVASGTIVGYITREKEEENGKLNYESVAKSALDGAKYLTEQKSVGAETVAAMYAHAFPNPNQYPFVALDGFVPIVGKTLELSTAIDIAYSPIVQPEEMGEFEEFALDYYNRTGMLDPNRRDGFHTEGFGPWTMADSFGGKFTRLPSRTGKSAFYPTKYTMVTPVFQHANPGKANFLMIDGHSLPNTGIAMERVLDCTQARGSLSFDSSCGSMSTTIIHGENTAGIVRSFYFLPIQAVNDPSKVVAFVSIKFDWKAILENVVPGNVNGLDCIFSNDFGESFTYTIQDGIPERVGNGDFHDTDFQEYGRSIVLNEFGMGESSPTYTLTIYPTDAMFTPFQSDAPRTVALGLVSAFAFCGIFFLLYDYFMRGESRERKIILETKRKFVKFISHEIRTPLNTVSMAATLLRAEIEENSHSSEQDVDANAWLEIIGDIEENSKSALGILNDVLNYDKVESGTITLETTMVPITNLLRQTVSGFSFQAKKQDVALDLSFGTIGDTILDDWNQLCIWGDDQRLRQVVRNLVSNALKFTSQVEGKVNVKADYVADGLPNSTPPLPEGNEVNSLIRIGSVRIGVQDNGAGMTTEQLSKLFGEGVQFNANKLQSGGGSGLGLYISKGLVEQHGGVVSVQSEGLGLGTTFVVELPLCRRNETIASARESAPGTKSDQTVETAPASCDQTPERHILIVDDVSSNRKLLRRLLERRGHTCLTAANGAEAITVFEHSEKPFDTICIDWEMPVMSGPEATKILREGGCQCLIVGLTGNVLAEDVEYFKQMGADEVLGKPLDMRMLEKIWSNQEEELSKKQEPV